MKRFFPAVLYSLLFVGTALGQHTKEILYVGTFSVPGSEGIYVFEFDRQQASLKLIQTVPTPRSPSFLEIHPSGKYLYSVNRGGVDERENVGSVSAFLIDPKTGKLSLLNQQSSYGRDPCHISFDKTGHWAFVANYSEGNFLVFPVLNDGLVGAPVDSCRHHGNSINRERQQKPHIHSSFRAPDNRFVLVCDLGTDEIYSYQLQEKTGHIVEANKPYVSVTPGCGPRHLTFHPNGNIVYAAEELTSTVGVFRYDSKSGSLHVLHDSIPSLPAAYSGINTAADIHVGGKGKFLYLSNRGHDALEIFAIQKNGDLKLIGSESTRGKTPRNFMIDRQGAYLFAANQDGDTIILFKIDQRSGALAYMGNPYAVPSPVCLKLLHLPE